MGLLSFIFENPDRVLLKLWEHFLLFGVSWIFSVIVGISIAIIATRNPKAKFGTILLSITSAAQAVPSIAVIAVVFIFVGIGSTPAIFALFLYSLVPIVFNTASGLLSVPNATKESATGMGMTKRQILTKVELPISVPSILSGVRSAATINIGTATIASAIGAGGLGELIFIGLKLMREEMIIAGALPAALLAILIDTALAFAESGITSKGIKLQN